jgi:hypothetical protein
VRILTIINIKYEVGRTLKHWIAVDLYEEAKIQCMKAWQPDAHAVSEMVVLGCDREKVYRAGWGQILRFPEKACEQRKPVSMPFPKTVL